MTAVLHAAINTEFLLCRCVNTAVTEMPRSITGKTKPSS